MINTEDNHPDLRMGKLAQELDNVIEELDNLSLETGEHANRPRYLDTLRLIGKVRTVLRTMEEIDPSHKRPETRRALERVTQQVGDLKELYKVNVRRLMQNSGPWRASPQVSHVRIRGFA